MKNSYLETIKSLDGKVYNLSYHQERYENVATLLGYKNFHNLNDFLKPPKNGLYRCRLVYNEKEITITYHPYIKKEIHSLKILYNDRIEYDKKALNREKIDELYALREDCDDILIVKNGYISDTSIANIALYKDGQWYTPAKPLLYGTTRQRLLNENRLLLADIKVDDLKSFSQVALLNAMIDFDIIKNISYNY